MAWNYRKRIKIAPGVNLNISKGGVSTSVGPKGAKITFGKNGTYMNTSIPGTGLYSRQKIGGGTGSSSDNKSSNNTGFGCLNLIISIICLCIGIIMCIFTKQTILMIIGLSLIIVGIVFLCTAINVLTSQKEERIVEPDTTNTSEQDNSSQNIIQKELSEENSHKEQKFTTIDISEEDRSFFMKFFDPLFVDAVILFIQHGTASISLMQRNLSIGYSRAGIIMDQLEQAGIVEPYKGSFSRKLLVHNNDEWLILKSRLLAEYAKRKTTNKTSKPIGDEDSSSKRLTEEQFYLIKLASDNLCDFICQISNKKDVINKIDEMLQVKNNDGTPWPISHKIQMAIFADIYRCYNGLGHNFSLDNDEENIGIYLFMCKYLRPDVTIKYDNISQCKFMLKDSFKNVLETSNILNQNTQMLPNEFVLQRVLDECDRSLKTQYISLLYRFASVVAKADGCISKTEEKWLADIMSSENIGNGSNVKTIAKKEQESLESPYTLLENLIGLSSVKEEITKLANFIKIQQLRESKGMKTPEISYHCVFTGNPGTGKTTVARIMASIYKDLGILKKGHLIETDRSGLVAEYVGQTAVKTNKIIDSALDGVLFIDEAYSLVQGAKEDFGQEAISTLLKRMEDDRNRLIVILAGYGNEMQTFIDSNPGLQSRFNRYINFPDYDADELLEIYKRNLEKHKYTLDSKAEFIMTEILKTAVLHKDKNFGNARFVRNLFEKTIENQAMRLAYVSSLTNEMLCTITEEDVEGLKSL